MVGLACQQSQMEAPYLAQRGCDRRRADSRVGWIARDRRAEILYYVVRSSCNCSQSCDSYLRRIREPVRLWRHLAREANRGGNHQERGLQLSPALGTVQALRDTHAKA